MREIASDVIVYESILRIYYNESVKCYLDQKTISVVDSFIEYCKAKDIVDNTKIAETMGIVYDSGNRMPKEEMTKALALSCSSLYRFRIKLINSFHKYLSDTLGGK